MVAQLYALTSVFTEDVGVAQRVVLDVDPVIAFYAVLARPPQRTVARLHYRIDALAVHAFRLSDV